MKKPIILGIIIILMGLAFLSVEGRAAKAFSDTDKGEYHLLAAATPLPTAESIPIEGPTPTARILPPVGRNAGLVIGAGMLVLIIFIGVLSSRLRSKH